jgi:hypothetical protein
MISRATEQTGRKNLRDFVEGGKGIIVLHHAVELPKVAWWYEEVVGGSYRLQRRVTIPHPVTMRTSRSRRSGGEAPDYFVRAFRGRNLQKHVALSPGPAPVERTPLTATDCWRGLARAPHPAWSPSNRDMVPSLVIRSTGPWSTTPYSGRPDGSSDSGERSQFYSPALKRGIAMKLGLYSITYPGLWYAGRLCRFLR